MAFSLSSVVATTDPDPLVRKVEYPANRDNPLYRLMFPNSKSEIQEDERREEEVIRWMVDGLIEILLSSSNGQREKLCKACRGEDGTPVGLVGWIVGQGPGQASTGTHKSTDNGEQQQQSKARKEKEVCGADNKIKIKKKLEVRGDNTWCPTTMDVASWLCVSAKLRKERERVLQNYGSSNICRKFCLVPLLVLTYLLIFTGITIMSVDPDYQRQGVGSMLMQLVCDEADRNHLDTFVLSSPAGVRLYAKFGFKEVGAVETTQGTFTSMLRKAGESHYSAPSFRK
jgi:hypothetical protein